MIRQCIVCLLVCFTGAAFVGYQASPVLAQQKSESAELIKNREFEGSALQWDGWTVAKGAGAQSGRKSKIEKADDGSIQLSGDSSTRIWNYVSQKLATKPGTYLQLSYSVKTTDLRRDEGQFDNCYIGLWMTDRNGKQVNRVFYPATRDEYVPEQFIIPVPAKATTAELAIFLSKSGTLNVKDLSLKVVEASESFDVLQRQMNRYYSYFDHKKIDWPKLSEKYRKAGVASAEDPEAFTKVILPMLAELKDGHVWIKSGRKIRSDYRVDWKPNCDFGLMDKQLDSIERFGKLGLVAKTKDGLGYIRVTSLQVDPAEMQRMIGAIDGLMDCPGMIVDLRMNVGGNEQLGKMLAGVFCEEAVTYAKQKFRLNESHDQFWQHTRTPVQPRDGKIYEKPVVCLIGPGAVSSAEGTAMMFAALPNVTLVGQPTRGSSGNPQPVMLPNGVEVWFSRWVAMMPDGAVIEDNGVPPDIEVAHGKGDPAWQRAVQELSEK